MSSMAIEQRPNIVFVLLDTVRADYLRLYGGSLELKNLDAIARKGTVYEHAIAPGTYTAPSHASLFLGKRTARIKAFTADPMKNYDSNIDPMVEHVKYISKKDITLAAKLRYMGYETALFSNNPFISKNTGLADGFEYVDNIWLDTKVLNSKGLTRFALNLIANKQARNSLINLAYALTFLMRRQRVDELYISLKRALDKHFAKQYGFYRLDSGASKTNKKIAKYLDTKSTDRCKFLFVNYMEGHEGYPTNLITNELIDQEKWLYMAGLSNEGNVKIISEAYKKRLAYLDSKLAELMQILKQKGVLDNAVVVFASDHGQAFMEHGLMYHNMFPFNELVHVPLVVAKYVNGKQVNTKERVEKKVSITALHNSILEIGRGMADDIDGKLRKDNFVFSDHVGITEVWDTHLLELLRRRSVNADKIYRIKKQVNTFATAVYYKEFKLIIYKNKRLELYNLKEDPEERDNIIGKNRSIAIEMLDASKAM